MFFFITVGVPAENFGLFAKIFQPFCENCFRRVQQKNLRKTFFNTFGVRAKPFLTVDGKLSAVLSKLLSTSPEESFEGLFFYTLTSQNHFGLFAKLFRLFCERCFRRFQEKKLRKTIFITFGVRATFFLTVDGKPSAVLSKLLSTSLEESFAGLFFDIITS